VFVVVGGEGMEKVEKQNSCTVYCNVPRFSLATEPFHTQNIFLEPLIKF